MNFNKTAQMLEILRLASVPGGQLPLGFMRDYSPSPTEEGSCVRSMQSDEPSVSQPHAAIPCPGGHAPLPTFASEDQDQVTVHPQHFKQMVADPGLSLDPFINQ